MRNLIWAFVVLVSVSGSAFAKDIALYEFGMRSTDAEQGEKYQSVRVSLDDEGMITAAIFPLNFGGIDLPQRRRKEVSKVLSPLALQGLRHQLAGLSKTELETYYSQIVCMIAVSPDMTVDHLSIAEDYDYREDRFLGELRLVLSPQGCWTGGGTFPKKDYSLQQARSLKAMLRFYALDLLAL